MSNSKSDSYAAAGVDITSAHESFKRIKPFVESTYTDGVIGNIGSFGGMFAPDIAGMKKPVTVSCTNGVGTKLKVAIALNKHNTIGIDCVAACVNDIICSGAKPMFFLDYLAMGKSIVDRTEKIVCSVSEGCRQAGCALIGGEIAQMPGMYSDTDYDLAGFAVGVVDEEKIIDGSTIADGDVLIGLSSSGLHSNGYSLVRKVFHINEINLNEYVPELSCTLGEELLKPSKIYAKTVLRIVDVFGPAIKGMCHIAGGGLYENVPRMLPEGICANILPSAFPTSDIFYIISKRGNVPMRDMFNTFNMGIGFVMAVDREKVGSVVDALIQCGERPNVIGRCTSGEKGVVLNW